jgi:UDP-3-O-[3-hydroxymyristoyl] glucosamine N-acyltransferase
MPSISEISRELESQIIGGDPTREITGVAGLRDARPDQISFLANDKYFRAAQATQAGAVIVAKNGRKPAISGSLLLVDNPSTAFAKICFKFYRPIPKETEGAHPSAVVHPTAHIHPTASICAGAVIDAHAKVGARTVIGPLAYIGVETEVGEDCHIHPHVSILHRCIIGNRVIIHANSVIGSDGFGFDISQETATKIPQIGIVRIDDDVEIGSNTSVDRARFGQTWIQQGTKIDNLVQIAHNVVIGPNCLIAGQSGIAGSARLGRRVIMAGQSGVSGHLEIGDGAIITGQTGVGKDVPAGQMVSGYHAEPMLQLKKRLAHERRLPEYAQRIAALEKKLNDFLANYKSA